MNKPICPICGQNDIPARRHPTKKDIVNYECPVCGKYAITRQADLNLQTMAEGDKAKISAYTRERQLHQMPRITILGQNPNTPSADGAVVAIDDILKAGFPLTVSEILDRALKNLHQLSPRPGVGIKLDGQKDYPVLFAEDEGAFRFIRNALQEEGFIDIENTVPLPTITLTVHGWNRIAELEREIIGKDSRQVFVAMWFDKELNNAYEEGFEKAIKAGGYNSLRIDLKEHNGKICDAIIAEIRKSRFMVADFTNHRGGVYFEAGYALGLGLPVIWSCREDHKDGLHFDTRQYNHILWTDEADLFKKLRQRIEATIPLG